MKVTKITDATSPKYPSSLQFQKSRAVMGAAAIGLGALVAGCASRPFYWGTGGKIASEPQSPVTTGGVIAVEPLVRTENYIVQPGDTLYSISKQTIGKGSRWRDIVALNTGLTPSNLKAGQTIRIPIIAP